MISSPFLSSRCTQKLSVTLSKKGFVGTCISRHVSSAATASAAIFDFEKIRQELVQTWINAENQSPGGMDASSRCGCFTYYDAVRIYREKGSNWHWLDREMSSNLAGETGAVSIYTGALAAMRLRPDAYTDEGLEFCCEHQANEKAHLQYFQSVIPPTKHTRLLLLWRMAGWTLGFSSTLIGGTRGLYVTVEAVETFVEQHFQEQIVPLREQGGAPELLRLLEHCCADEVHHKEDAARRLLNLDEEASKKSELVSAWWVKPWTQIVWKGSSLAAEVARRL